MQGLDSLRELKLLALTGNRLTELEGLSALTKLTDLYLGENGLTVIAGLDANTRLETLELAMNQVCSHPFPAPVSCFKGSWITFYFIVETRK